MPLRDHFRPPVDDRHSWEGLHGVLPAMIVRKLHEFLPEPYVAAPRLHRGPHPEPEFINYCDPEPEPIIIGENGAPFNSYAPPRPTLTLEPELPNQDVYEVRIYDSRRRRRLVAAVEIVSPSNKGRPDSRTTFVSKVATLLKNNVCVTIVDVASTMHFNLYAELMDCSSSHPSCALHRIAVV